MEGIPNNAILISTRNARVTISTTTYGGGQSTVGLYTSSNVVVGNSNACTIYSTGSITCIGTITGSAAATPWRRSGTNVILVNTADSVGIGPTAPAVVLDIAPTAGTAPTIQLKTPNTSNPALNLLNSAGVVKASYGYNAGAGQGGDQLTLGYAGLNTLNIDSSQGVMIGTNTFFPYTTAAGLTKIVSAVNNTLILAGDNAQPTLVFRTGVTGEDISFRKVNTVNGGFQIVDSGQANVLWVMNNRGHIEHLGFGAPTVGSGIADCGTAPAIVGRDMAGKITVGTGANGSLCTVTFQTAWTNAPICLCNNETTANLARAASVTTTAFTCAGTLTAGDVISFYCVGRQ